MPKKPQDHKPKKDAVDNLRAESLRLPMLDELRGLSVTVGGRHGKVTVQALDDPLDWDAEVVTHLGHGDYLSAICGVLSDEDAARVRAVKPSIRDILTALTEPVSDADGNGDGELSVGESQAS
jgi:hypothetical protein